MSVGHNREEPKPLAELASILGEKDTPEIIARTPEINCSHDIPYAGGTSVDGKTVYLDRGLVKAIKDGTIRVHSMCARDIIKALIKHEHTEVSTELGDNPSDSYQSSHAFALAAEFQFVDNLSVNPERYNGIIEPPAVRCAGNFVKLGSRANPPKDLWCGPILDNASKQDKEILRILRAKNVEDAFKLSKLEVHYGSGPRECRDCAMFNAGSGPLRKCDLISGMVRNTRWCEKWSAKSKGNGHG